MAEATAEISWTSGEREYPYSYSPSKAGLINWLRRKLAPGRFGLAARVICRELGFLDKGEHSCLEIGCGLGLLGEEIKKRVEKRGASSFHYYGVELLFPSAKEAGKKMPMIVADAVSLPFKDASFSRIVCTDVLEHVHQPEKLIAEMRRVLEREGMAFVVIADPSEGRFHLVEGHLKRSSEGTDVRWWEKRFRKAGFKVLPQSERYRRKDWRRIFNFPLLGRLKDTPGFACAFNPVYRPGVFILQVNKS